MAAEKVLQFYCVWVPTELQSLVRQEGTLSTKRSIGVVSTAAGEGFTAVSMAEGVSAPGPHGGPQRRPRYLTQLVSMPRKTQNMFRVFRLQAMSDWYASVKTLQSTMLRPQLHVQFSLHLSFAWAKYYCPLFQSAAFFVDCSCVSLARMAVNVPPKTNVPSTILAIANPHCIKYSLVSLADTHQHLQNPASTKEYLVAPREHSNLSEQSMPCFSSVHTKTGFCS